MTPSWRTPVVLFVVLIGQLGLSFGRPAVEYPSAAAAAAATTKVVTAGKDVTCAMRDGVCIPDFPTVERTMAAHQEDLPPFGKILFHAAERCAKPASKKTCEAATCKWHDKYCEIGDDDPELSAFAADCMSGKDKSVACKQFSLMFLCAFHFTKTDCRADPICQWGGAEKGCQPSEGYLSKIQYGEVGTPLRDLIDSADAECSQKPAATCS